MIERKYTWRSDLSAYIHSVARAEFLWGQHDCALFSAGAVEVMTGVDIGSEYRGKYKTLAGGLKLLKRKGFDNHAQLAASLFEEIPVAMASVGDIAAIEVETGGVYALGVVQGPRIYVVRPDESGLGTVDLLTAARAFKVG